MICNIFAQKRDWKNFLSNDAREILANVFDLTNKHRGAYLNADKKELAQLWCAIIELKKDLDEIKRILGKIEEPFKAIISIGEEEKRKAIERIISEIVKPTDQATQEATQKLINSLMNF